MREIKFRGKRLNGGDWAYGYYRNVGSAHVIYNDIHLWQVDPSTIGQLHNGLTKKVGKEVYVGDRIRYGLKEGLGEPEVRNLTGVVNDIEFDYAYYFDVRVIGTIHDKEASL